MRICKSGACLDPATGSEYIRGKSMLHNVVNFVIHISVESLYYGVWSAVVKKILYKHWVG